MGELASVYWRLIGARVRSDLQYRTSMALYTLGQFLASFVDFLAVAVIFGRIDALAGWSLNEVAVLFGLTATAFGLADVFVSEVERVAERIRTGTFDQLLVRPLGTLLQICTDEFELRRVGRLLQGPIILAIAVPQAGIDWTVGRVAMVPVTIVSGAVIFGAVWVIGATLAFWTTEGGEVVNSFTYGGNFLTQYPLAVYSRWLRRILAFVVPLAFVNYFPALYLLGRARHHRRALVRPLRLAARRRGHGVPGAGGVATRDPPVPVDRELIVVIEARNLTKMFVVRRKAGRLRRERVEVRAVEDVSFAVERGSVVGYIGPNGAGKSTTIKMLTGILTPSSGSASVAELDPSRQRVDVARRIGVVFGHRTQLWWDLPLADSFDLLRHIYRVDADRHRANLDECTSLLELGPFLATPVRQLSLGQRMRAELTAALLHDPELLFLDEPTIGLDVVSKERVREFLEDLNARRGTTILLTTHDLADVERLCQRLLIIDHGRVISDGTVAAVRERFGTERTLVVDLEAPGPPLSVPGATVTKVDGPRQWLRFRRADTTAAALVAAVAAVAPLRDLSVEEPSIDDIVRRIYTNGVT